MDKQPYESTWVCRTGKRRGKKTVSLQMRGEMSLTPSHQACKGWVQHPGSHSRKCFWVQISGDPQSSDLQVGSFCFVLA
jgi:hypothetical protein